MLKVEKWAQNINPLIAYFAVTNALIAREKCDALRHIKERKVYQFQFPLPDLPSWFAMYRSRKPLLAYKRLISNTSELTTNQMQLYLEFRKFQKAINKLAGRVIKIKITPTKREKALKYWGDLCSKVFEEIKEDIAETPLKIELQEKFRKALVDDEIPLGFYYLIYLPCLMFYDMTPAVLYRIALNGDISAIEKLLKIDPLILHDPAIGFQIQTIRLYGRANDYLDILGAITKNIKIVICSTVQANSLYGRANDYLDILGAITKQPKINYKMLADERRSVKSDHGAQIYVLAKALNNPLQVPQIRDLYDMLAADYEGTLIDTDIKKPEGFDKTIKTKAVTWQKEYQKMEKLK